MKPTLLMLFLALGLITAPVCSAQTAHTDESLDRIDEATVKQTVSYLASDEMAGRDTPSPELDRAAGFVAQRFQKAGLSGGGDEGTFFQTASIATTSLPATFELESDGKPVEHLGLLGAGQEEFRYEGKIELVADTESPGNFNGPVAFVAGKIESPVEQLDVLRTVGRLKRRGATAVLIQTGPDSGLVAMAARNGRPRILNPRERLTVPTILVRKFDDQADYRIDVPGIRHGKTDVRNVIGLIRGSDPDLAQQAVVFSAHLDHIGQQAGLADPIFNGADDNATGVTAVILLAEAYAALPTPPRHTVVFMTFWGEERGLLGSKYYVEHPTWPLDKIVANINIEMIGRPEAGARHKCWMTGWHQSDLGLLMAKGSQAAGVEIFEHPRLSAMLYGASDNASFARHGVVAHSFSAGSLHSDYHQPGDEWEKLDLEHMTSVIRGLFAGSLPIAQGEQTPTKSPASGNRQFRPE